MIQIEKDIYIFFLFISNLIITQVSYLILYNVCYIYIYILKCMFDCSRLFSSSFALLFTFLWEEKRLENERKKNEEIYYR